jgi:hypothetical protein
MPSLIDRDYCVRHPGTIIRLFGIGVFLRMLFGPRRSLLELLAEHYASHGYPLPGRVGDAYRISSLLEFRMARIYRRFAARFRNHPLAYELFEELRQEEQEHGRLMLLCRYTMKHRPDLAFVPSVRDPEIHGMLKELRRIERSSDNLSLAEALDITEQLEKGEVNTIFNRLLKQTEHSESCLFKDKMQQMEGHSTSVPRRLQALRKEALPAQ